MSDQNKGYSWQWLDEVLVSLVARSFCVSSASYRMPGAKAQVKLSIPCQAERDKAVAAIQSHIDEHYIGKGEAESAYRRGYNTGWQKNKRVSNRMSGVARQLRTIVETLEADEQIKGKLIGPNLYTESEVEQRCIEAEGRGEYMSASRLLQHVGYLLEHRRQGLPEMTSNVIDDLYDDMKAIMNKNKKFLQLSTNNKDTLERNKHA